MKLRIRPFIRALTSWVCAFAVALSAVSVLLFGYNYHSPHLRNENGATDYVNAPLHWMVHGTEGYGAFRTDANGYNNKQVFSDGIDVLLMGGSHMEALQIMRKYNTASRLNTLMPELHTYNIGLNMHQLVHCLDNLEAAVNEYKPRYVVLQFNSVDFDASIWNDVAEHRLADQTPSRYSGVWYLIHNIPGIIMFASQLSIKAAKDLNSLRKTGSADINEPDAALIQRIFAEKGKFCEDRGTKLILAYTPPIALRGAELIRSDKPELVRTVRSACESAGIIFTDLFEDFEQRYKESFELPYGFRNTAMPEGHMNKVGHELLADRLAAIISGSEAGA